MGHTGSWSRQSYHDMKVIITSFGLQSNMNDAARHCIETLKKCKVLAIMPATRWLLSCHLTCSLVPPRPRMPTFYHKTRPRNLCWSTSLPCFRGMTLCSHHRSVIPAPFVHFARSSIRKDAVPNVQYLCCFHRSLPQPAQRFQLWQETSPLRLQHSSPRIYIGIQS